MKTVFLDRDGVINHDSSAYIKRWEEFEFLPGSLEAIKLLTDEMFTIIIITNQSIINRGMAAQNDLEHIFSNMKEAITQNGGKITDIFHCPHTPEENCACRKPSPGMVFAAQKKYNIDLSYACFVGDSAKDMECAKRAGCAFSILVKTGNGADAIRELANTKNAPDYVAENLLEAAKIIITRFSPE